MSASYSDNTEFVSNDYSSDSTGDGDGCSTNLSGEHQIVLLLDMAEWHVGVFCTYSLPNMVALQRRPKRSKASCKLCLKKTNHQGNTTYMMVHLHYNHCTEFLKG